MKNVEVSFKEDLSRIASIKGITLKEAAVNLRNSFRVIGDREEAERMDQWIRKYCGVQRKKQHQSSK